MLNYPMVVKKDGRREAFSKEKILNGLQASCQKRPVSLLQLETVVEKIAGWLINRADSEISSQLIGQKVMFELKKIDDVAYVRFASVYRNFKDVQEFVETLEEDEFGGSKDSQSPQLTLTSFDETSTSIS